MKITTRESVRTRVSGDEDLPVKTVFFATITLILIALVFRAIKFALVLGVILLAVMFFFPDVIEFGKSFLE